MRTERERNRERKRDRGNKIGRGEEDREIERMERK